MTCSEAESPRPWGTGKGDRGHGEELTQFVVRRATADDLDTVVALRIALLREYQDHPIYGRLRPDAEQRARLVFGSQLESSHEVIFLAEQRDETVGLIRCVESSASPLLIPERYCYVSSAYVLPAHRRHGVLRALLDRVVDWCHERGLMEMRLHNVGTRENSAAAWDSMGFEVVEQVRVRRLTDARATDAFADLDDSSSLRL
jgi:GNAT superfamily N-acetyltransferase